MKRILVFNLQNCIRDSKIRTINYITKKYKHIDFQNQLLLPTWATGELQIEFIDQCGYSGPLKGFYVPLRKIPRTTKHSDSHMLFTFFLFFVGNNRC